MKQITKPEESKMPMSLKMKLKLKQREIGRRKHQTRIWANEELYRKFAKSVKGEGMKITDVFEEFMRWFLRDYT